MGLRDTRFPLRLPELRGSFHRLPAVFPHLGKGHCAIPCENCKTSSISKLDRAYRFWQHAGSGPHYQLQPVTEAAPERQVW